MKSGTHETRAAAATAALMIIAATLAPACSHAPPPPRLTRDLDVEGLEVAVRWPQPAVPVVMALANQYLSTGRDRDGHAYFCARAQEAPTRPLFGALCGMFQARSAGEVPLLHILY
jgi:hypothetical protein